MFTDLLIIVTAAVSIVCFNKYQLFEHLSLKPYRVVQHQEWWRIITHGFVHADWIHLLVNMFTFWSFGGYIETAFEYLGFGKWAFLTLYFGGMIAAPFPTSYATGTLNGTPPSGLPELYLLYFLPPSF